MFSALLLPLLLMQAADEVDAPEPAFGPLEIGVAADILGLEFSEDELELMLADVSERLREFERLRAIPLDNAVRPALVFEPRVFASTASAPSPPRLASRPVPASAPRRPADLEELAFAGIGELAALLVAREVTCVELAEMYLARLERLDPTLHCVISLTRERALAQARERDRELSLDPPQWRGPLHGIPWVAKDLLAVKGYPTTWGAAPYREQVLDLDAAVVERLDAAGAVLIAKVTLGALAWGDVWFGGRTRNPWNPERGSSGSSAGSASAVAAGCAPFAIGSETLGSIVSPSHQCGNSSLRPSFGRVSRHGAMALSWSMDKLGPLCRSVADTALVFAAIDGPDPRDVETRAASFAVDLASPPDVRGWKIGVPPGAFDGPNERCATVLDELESLGVELVDIELPDYPTSEMTLILTAEAGAAFDDFTRAGLDDQLVRQERRAWPNVFRQAQLIPAVDYIRANRLRTSLIAAYERALTDVRAIVHPSYAGDILTATNLTGHPTLVAPCGFDDDGLPYSISFTARLDGENELVELGRAWQSVTAYHLERPKL